MSNPECPFYRTDCFAFKIQNGEEKCTALADTFFRGTECPFYKTSEQFKRDLKKYPWANNTYYQATISEQELKSIDYDELLEWYYQEHPQKISELYEVLKDTVEVRRFIDIKKGEGNARG